jgi:hypothetical protein
MQSRATSHHFRSRAALAALLGVGFAPRFVQAQDDRAASASPADVTAQRSAAVGAFSTWTMTARSDMQHAVVNVMGGFDGANDGARFESSAEAQILPRVALRAGASTSPASEGLGLRFEGKVDAFRQERDGVDLAVAGGYEQHGFNEVSAAVATVAVGRSLGRLQLLGNLGYARGIAQTEEHYGSAGVAALYRVAEPLHVGLDSRFRIDLERDDDEPPGEREWELEAGPKVTVSAGSFALTGGTGVVTNRLRLVPGTNVGAIGYVGVGAAF